MFNFTDTTNFHQLLSAINDQIYVLDYSPEAMTSARQGTISFANNAFATAHNLTVKEIIGQRKEIDFCQKEDIEKILTFNQAILKDKVAIEDRGELRSSPDGTERFISTSRFPIFENSEIVGIAVISRDITQRKVVEQQLFGLSAQALHDVISTMNSVLLNLEVVAQGIYGPISAPLGAALADLIEVTEASGRKTRECLIRVTATDQIIIKKERLDLRRDIIDPVIKELSVSMKNASVTIDNHLGQIPVGKIQLDGDVIGLRFIYRTIITNAIQAGATLISLGYEHFGTVWRLNIGHNGSPVPPDRVDKLFKRGQGSSKINGLGIALWQSSKIIKEHRGTIKYAPTKNEQANFIIDLPQK